MPRRTLPHLGWFLILFPSCGSSTDAVFPLLPDGGRDASATGLRLVVGFVPTWAITQIEAHCGENRWFVPQGA